jgi:hypothetical protein
MKADYFDKFLTLAQMMAQQGYVIVRFETNGTDINLRLVEGDKKAKNRRRGLDVIP